MKLKKILTKGFILLFLAVVPIGLFVRIMDPYQFFKSDTVFLEQERFQIPGLARNQVFDTAIIGTSMIENFVDLEVSKVLDANAIKLPINASYITEQGMVLDMAVKHNRVHHIIWNIDYRCINIPYGEFYKKEIEFPKYMYDEQGYNDLRYIINHSNLFLSIKKLNYRFRGHDRFDEFRTNLSTLNSWYNWQEFGEKLLIDDYLNMSSGKRKLSDNLRLDIQMREIEKVIDREIIDRIEKNKDIRFSLTFPPKSILWFRLLEDRGILKDKEYAQLYLLKKVSTLPNVDVYNFQNIYDITENFNIYHDLNHYDKSGNDFMINSIKNKKHITNENKYREEMTDLRKHISSDRVNLFLNKNKSRSLK